MCSRWPTPCAPPFPRGRCPTTDRSQNGRDERPPSRTARHQRLPFSAATTGNGRGRSPMIRREIDILVEAARKQCAVVEKASHIPWTCEELREAAASGLYQGPDRLLPPDSNSGVTGPFPGCCQQGGVSAGVGGFRAVGQ